MPPSTLQARIKAFEALGTGASKEVLDSVAIHPEPEHILDRPHSPTAVSIPPMLPTYSPSASPSSLRNRSSLIDLKDWVIDDGPLGASPTTTILSGCSPAQSIKPLPHQNAPLISFEGSPPKSVKVPPLPPRKLSFNSPRSVSAPAASPTPTNATLTNSTLMPPQSDHPSASKLTGLFPPDGTRRAQGHVPASSVSSFHSVSLSSDGDDVATPDALHAFAMERDWTGTGTEDGESLDESFENVSAPSSFLPSIALPPRPAKHQQQQQQPPSKPTLALATKQSPSPQPPRLPQRPVLPPRGSGSTSSLTSQGSSPPSTVTSPILTRPPSACSSSLSLTSTRRAPPPPPAPPPAAITTITAPPPPPRSRPPSARTSVQSTATTGSSDHSSLFSQATTTTSRTSTSTSSHASAHTHAPAAKQAALATARARYDALFIANARAHVPRPPLPAPPAVAHAKRQNAGWRGLSIDMDLASAMSAPAPAPTLAPALTPEQPAPDTRLDGRVVRAIWFKSCLEHQRLRDIWNECDPDGAGSLDRDAFARGMGRIDEELRRARVLGRPRAGSITSPSARAPRPVPSRPILR
ncbi:hypothetical protein BC826DRAFT_1097619 [Russula brevipes]|nr:hypothetical protein BC826DRAFT_1097619 [Russula brevipes]